MYSLLEQLFYLGLKLMAVFPFLLVVYKVHAMLFTLKEDHTSGSFCLCCLLYVLSMIIQSGAVCKSFHLYTIIICTYDMVVYKCPYLLLITCVLAVECICMLILQSYG